MHFTQYKTTWLAAISSHCLAALPVKMAVIARLPPDLETKVQHYKKDVGSLPSFPRSAQTQK